MSNFLEVEIRVEEPLWDHAAPELEATCQMALRSAADSENIRKSASVSVLFTNNTEMQELNRQWRHKDKPTDVLSFPAGGAPTPDGSIFLGDIALGLETCRDDASELARQMDFHVSHLLIHGFLHLLGYDHEEPADAEKMEQRETLILSNLGYPHPYDEEAPPASRRS